MVFSSRARSMGIAIVAVIRRFDRSNPGSEHSGTPDTGRAWVLAEEVRLPIDTGGADFVSTHSGTFPGAEWRLVVGCSVPPDRDDACDIGATFEVTRGRVDSVTLNLEAVVADWSEANYVLIPAVAYAGNRFDTRRGPYPPMFTDPADIRVDLPTTITEVAPHLAKGDGPSAIHQTTGDPSTPAMAFWGGRGEVGVVGVSDVGVSDVGAVGVSEVGGSEVRVGFIMLTEQQTTLGNSGLSIEEAGKAAGQRRQCTLRISAPALRPDPAKGDAPANLAPEDGEVTLRARLCAFPCADVQALMDRFAQVRKDLSGPVVLENSLPFSQAWAIQEAKYNRDNWNEQGGYYTVGTGDAPYDDWQLGWVGGGMTTFPLLAAGTELSRARALRNLDFMFTTQAASGLMHGTLGGGDAIGDGFGKPGTRDWLLIRKDADALYFLLKHFSLIKRAAPEWQPPGAWEEGTRRLADAFVTLWQRYGQFGQFVDVTTGEIMVGGSTSASTAPAGLALAAKHFGNPSFMEVAEAAGDLFWQRDVVAGVTTGGPGEILQNPDGESAFGLLESFVVLYETTGDPKWLGRAEAMARQASTWCVSYDYRFPQASEFGKLGMRAAGSVIANAQNKHSAPGICTLSGDSLFKLFRYTGNAWYLTLVQEIAHNCVQYLSRSDRPIHSWDGRPLPAGWMCERVNLSDWETKANVGGVFHGSCWCETSNMLSYVELPGVYVQPDAGLVCAIDHVTADLAADGLSLRLCNDTAFAAAVRVMVETSAGSRSILGQGALAHLPEVCLGPGESKSVRLGELARIAQP